MRESGAGMRTEWLNKDFYGILGVDPTSSAEQIKRAYRTRQRATHPDLHADDPTAEALAKSLNEAHAVLSDPTSRKEYDRHLQEVARAVRGERGHHADPPPTAPRAGQSRGGQRPGSAARGSDFYCTAPTPKTVLAHGGVVDLEIAYCQPCKGSGQLMHEGRVIDCSTCGRTGFTEQSPGISVAVPPGLSKESVITYPGMGAKSREGGQSGDLVVLYVAVPDPSTSPTSSNPDPGEGVAAPPQRRVRLVAVALGLIGVLALAAWVWRVAGAPEGGSGLSGAPATPSATPSAPAITFIDPATTPPAATVYTRYANARFGFAVDILPGWTAGPEADSGDGIVHYSPDGLGVLTVYGANNLDGESLEARSDAFQQGIVDDGGRVTFTAQSGDHFTVSGYDADGDIFYTREWVGPGSSNTLTWTYPAAQKEQYDDLVNHVVESFTPGDLESVH